MCLMEIREHTLGEDLLMKRRNGGIFKIFIPAAVMKMLGKSTHHDGNYINLNPGLGQAVKYLQDFFLRLCLIFSADQFADP